MFIGHYGLAYALKRAEPRISLPALFIAVQWVDLLWMLFIAMGWEHVNLVPGFLPANSLEFVDYPITHSLLAAVLWALLAGAVYYSWPTKDTSRHKQRTLIVMFAVASHWLLDLVAHTPDLPLTGNDSIRLGFGLWRSLPATLVVEFGLLLGGLALLLFYRPSRKHPPRTGRLLVVTAVLSALYLLSLFGPPPPSLKAIWLSGLIGAPIIVWLAWWADRPLGER